MRISDWSSDGCSSDLMVLDPLGLKPLFGHPRRRRPDLVLRLTVDPLRLQRAMIYAGINIQLGQALVDVIGQPPAPFLQERRAVPLAHLLADALRPYLAAHQPDIRGRLGLPGSPQLPKHIHFSHIDPLPKLIYT